MVYGQAKCFVSIATRLAPPMPVSGFDIDHPWDKRLGTTAVAKAACSLSSAKGPDFANPPLREGFEKLRHYHLSMRMGVRRASKSQERRFGVVLNS